MAKIYVKNGEISSLVAWMYVTISKSKVEVIQLEDSNELSKNPMKIFPYLVDNDTQIWGELGIIEYLADKAPSNLYFGASVGEKAQINSILYWISGSFSRCSLRNYVYPQREGDNLCKLELESDNTLLIDHGLKSTSLHMDRIEKNVFNDATKKTFFEKETIVDYYFALVLCELEKFNFKLDAWKNTQLWFNNFKPEMEKVLSQMV